MAAKPIRRFVLHDDGIRKNAIAFLSGLNLGGPVKIEVVIQPHKRNRSLEQNAYYWVLVGIIAKSLGHSKIEQHEIFKIHYLLPILMESDPDVQAMVEALGVERDRLAKLLSTTDLKTHQFAEFIEDVINFAGQMQIHVPDAETAMQEVRV